MRRSITARQSDPDDRTRRTGWSTTEKLEDINKELTAAQSGPQAQQGGALCWLKQSGNALDARPAVRESPVIQDVLKQQSAWCVQYAEVLNQRQAQILVVLRLVDW